MDFWPRVPPDPGFFYCVATLNSLDFKILAQRLLSDARDLLPRWLPSGVVVGAEFCVGSLQGEQGKSLKINLNSGKWADFSTGQSGLDILSLYAAIRGIKNGEAYKELSDDSTTAIAKPAPQKAASAPLTAPPNGTSTPSMVHAKHGLPSASWCYRNPTGEPMFYVARYETPEGKTICPWSWDGKRWVSRSWPAPRPLYGLEQLSANSTRPCLIVEGEKAAEAAKQIVQDRYNVLTWAHGAEAHSKTAWEPLYGRRLLIWPDADKPGVKAAHAIAARLSNHCQQIKVIDTAGQPEGWDAADAIAAGWNWETFKKWSTEQTQPKVVPIDKVVPPDRLPTPINIDARQINFSVESQDIDITNHSAISLYEQLGIACNGNGQPILNIDNVVHVLKNLPGLQDLVWFDEFHNRYFTCWPHGKLPTAAPATRREWLDNDDINFAIFLQRHVALKRISDEIVSKAISSYAKDHTKNEPRDWLTKLIWDGQPRISDFLTACFGAEQTEYTQAASRNFWIGLVARIYRPGCQLDNMLVLEGAQGSGKTRALRLLGGDWYTSAKESIQRNDFFMVLQGKLIVEIAELDSFSRAEVTRIKQVVSDPMDRYRAPYERRASDHPRACVFIGTTNEETYLRDQTGSRRFWPISCGAINYDLIMHHRDQFFAEASVAYQAQEPWYIMPAATQVEQELRRQFDEWESIINGFLQQADNLFYDEISIQKLATDCLKIDISKLDKMMQMRIAVVLRRLGWKRKTSFNSNGSMKSVWQRPVNEA